jgi:hypothetical protein
MMKSRLRMSEQVVLDRPSNPEKVGFEKTFFKRKRLQAAFLSRLKMATFGALAFLVPMLIMVLHPTKLTVLLTTVVCVLFVAVALAASMQDADNKDILAATAAYTAVLVVFIGSSNTTSGLSNGVIGAITAGVLGGAVLLGPVSLSYCLS